MTDNVETFHGHDHAEVIEAEIPRVVLQGVAVVALVMIAAYFGYAIYRDRNSDRLFQERMDRLAAKIDRPNSDRMADEQPHAMVIPTVPTTANRSAP